MAIQIKQPFEMFFNKDGSPLNDGNVYIGIAGMNPETNPISIFSDSSMSTPVAQPLKTTNGYISINGSARDIFAQGDYSITVKDKNGVLMYSSLTNNEDGIVSYLDNVSDLANFGNTNTSSPVIVKDLNRGGTFIWSATGTANGGTVFAGATGYWNRQYSGAINVKWFGAKGDGISDDYLPILNAISINSGNYISVFFPKGYYTISQKLELIGNNIKLFGESGKASLIKPHSSFVAPASPTFLFSTKQSWSADYNFFIEIEDLSFDANQVPNLGALNFQSGGGSSLKNSYIIDGGTGATTCRLSGVAYSVESIYVGSKTAVPVNNIGLLCESISGVTINGSNVDYCSNALGMYAINLSTATSLVFNCLSMEGNKCPIYSYNSGGVTFVSAEIYRLGKGAASPSTDPDIVLVGATSIDNCPSFINSLVWYGYLFVNGGGILKIGSTIFDIKTNSIGYFNLNSVSKSTIFQDVDHLGYKVSNASLVAPNINGSYLGTGTLTLGTNVVKVINTTIITTGTTGSFDVLFKGAGMLLITAVRNDSQLYSQTILGIFSGSFDAATWTEISRNSASASYNYISTVVKRVSNSGITITYDATTKATGTISVTFIGAIVTP